MKLKFRRKNVTMLLIISVNSEKFLCYRLPAIITCYNDHSVLLEVQRNLRLKTIKVSHLENNVIDAKKSIGDQITILDRWNGHITGKIYFIGIFDRYKKYIKIPFESKYSSSESFPSLIMERKVDTKSGEGSEHLPTKSDLPPVDE